VTTGPWPTITVDPRIAFGEPCIGTPPTRVADLAGMVAAGETVDTTAGEYGRTRHEVLLACWWEATHGRYRQQWGAWAEQFLYIT
jgi:Uncharacterized conserved protein